MPALRTTLEVLRVVVDGSSDELAVDASQDQYHAVDS